MAAPGESRHDSRARRHDYDSFTTRPTRHDSSPAGQRLYDSRYFHLPPPPARHVAVADARHSPPPSHARRRWPPQPSVEEERDALSKELGSREASEANEVFSRGSIDQEPIILDVHADLAGDRRFVWLASEPDDTSDNLTPPTSDDERRLRGRRKVPKLDTVFCPPLPLPEMSRTPSPYSFSKPAPFTKSPRSSGEFLSSPSLLTPLSTSHSSLPRQAPPPTSAPRPLPAASRHASFCAPRVKPSTSLAAPSSYDVFDEPDLGATDSEPRRTQRRPAQYSFVKQDVPPTARTSALPHMPPPPTTIPSRTLPEDLRKHSDVTTTVPKQQFADRVRRPAPVTLANLMHENSNASSQSQDSRPGSSSRCSSHEPSTTLSRPFAAQYPPSPPRSPRYSGERTREATPTSIPQSRLASREGSGSSSPQRAPYISQSLPVADNAWHSAFANNAARRSRPSSRLVASTLQEPDTHSSGSGASPARRASNLPYPEDYDMYQTMPAARDHHVYPDQAPLQERPLKAAKTVSRPGTPRRTTPPRSRPSLPSWHSVAEGLLDSPDITHGTRHKSFSNSPRSSQSVETAPASRPLPPCSRPEYSIGHDDWYTLDGCTAFDICPECVDMVFGSTIYRSYFRRSPRKSDSVPTKCCFSDPWMRLAWLLTQQRQLPSLILLKMLSNLASAEDQPCPGGGAEAIRSWYTIRDHSNYAVRNFTVCAADVRKIETLLPNLRGLFVPLSNRTSFPYSSSSMGRVCALRTSSNNRFPLYLDSLIALHESASIPHRLPDATSFLELVRHKAGLCECTRDDMLVDQPWHIMPSLPCFTICEDCYDELVAPALADDSDVAMRFNRSAHLVQSEGRLGSSCQLYSPRMRGLWKRAVEDGDLKTLAREARERKQVEDRLQGRVAEVRQRLRRLRETEEWEIGVRGALDKEVMLEAELENAVEEWSLWE